jgi:hypothetical protein
MLIRTFLSAVILAICLPVSNAQHFIGEKKDEVRRLMAQHVKGLFEDTSSRNTAVNMIKYTDRFQNQTMIFVFDEEDICRYSKHMCDYSLLNGMKDKLDKEYRRLNDTTWTYEHESFAYNITLKKDEWYFVLDTRKAEE